MVEKNQRKRENKRTAKETLKEEDQKFESMLDEYQEGIMAEKQEERDSDLSQKVAAAEEGEEWRKPKSLTSPMRVTAEERALHDLTHIPYKPQCKYCVWARARHMAHTG